MRSVLPLLGLVAYSVLLLAGVQGGKLDEPRLGVAFVLAYGESIPEKSSFWRHETTLCTLLANLESTVATLREWTSLKGSIEPIVMTLKETMPDDVASFFDAAGVEVRDIREAMAPLKTNGIPYRGTPWLQAIKVHAVRLTEFDAILTVDVDIFLSKLAWNWDVFGELIESDKRFILQTGFSSPINAGFFAVKPARDLAKRLDDALEHGYNPDDDFYGGDYSKAIESLGKGRYHGKAGWHYLGANTDQGLLLHLINSEPYAPQEFMRDSRRLPLIHLAGMSPKTWFPDPYLDECLATSAKTATFPLAKQVQDRVARCYGGKRNRFEYSFWFMWNNQLHNQTWTEKTVEHAKCDAIMSTELERRKAILGDSVFMVKQRVRGKAH